MMAEAHTIPDDTAAHYARLISEAESMRQAGADALKAAYADLRADLKQLGWAGSSISVEVAAFKGAIAEMALDEKEKNKREEKSERVDDYVSLLTRARARGQRKTDERFDPISGEFLDDNVDPKLAHTIVTGLQTETGRKALIAAVDILIEREEAEERRSDAGLDIVSKHTEIATNEGGANPEEDMAQGSSPDLEPSGPEAERATHSPEEAPKFPTNPEEEAEAKGAATDDAEDRGEGDKDRQRSPEPGTTDGRRQGGVEHLTSVDVPAPSFLTKPPSPLRPNCQRPEMCAGVGRTHCHTCTKAMREHEEVA